MGGLFIRVFADCYPNEVAGMVLLDAVHPDRTCGALQSIPIMRTGFRFLKTATLLARLGYIRIARVVNDWAEGLPARQAAEADAFLSSHRHLTTTRDESLAWGSICAEVRDTRGLGDTPLAVVTAGRAVLPGHPELQTEIAGLSSDSVHFVVKGVETPQELDRYKPLVTFDNREEIIKIGQHAPHSGLALRLRVLNTGAMVELSSKYGAGPGEAVDLILEAEREGLTVEGLSFHVGSQTTNFENFVQATNLAAHIFREARERGYDKMFLLDIGSGFPAPYDASVKPFSELARKINAELDRLFPPEIEILAESGRFMVATAGTAVSKIIGKARRYGTGNSAITSMTGSITPSGSMVFRRPRLSTSTWPQLENDFVAEGAVGQSRLAGRGMLQ